MFDSFEPFLKLTKTSFSFQASRYEGWKGGQIFRQGKSNAIISATVIGENGEERVAVDISDHKLFDIIANINVFDEFITSRDRLQLIVIPIETNSSNVAIELFKMNIGATRQVKHFAKNEPFCCNIFLMNRSIAKITFSFSNPEMLLEFYND